MSGDCDEDTVTLNREVTSRDDIHELIKEFGHAVLNELWEEPSPKHVTVSIEVDDAE